MRNTRLWLSYWLFMLRHRRERRVIQRRLDRIA